MQQMIKSAQTVLAACAGYGGKIDGVPGQKSLEAAWRVLGPGGFSSGQWSDARKVIAAAQHCLDRAGFEPGPRDGFWGVQTDGAFLEWRASGLGLALPDRSAEFGLQRQLPVRFGPAGGPQCTAGRVTVPFDMVLAWDPSQRIKHIRCHQDVAASAQRAFRKIADAYSTAERKALGLHLYGGCFNHRKMRGGTALSTHAWGVAIDFDPARNRLHWKSDRARLAQADAVRFWEIWEAEGWTSLGRARGFDWMHVQAPGL